MRRLLTILVLLAWPLLAGASRQSLGGAWSLDYWQQGQTPVRSPEAFTSTPHRTIPATVPGNVELDLLAAGLIEQPEIGSNVYLLRPWEGFQWRYSRNFTTPDHGAEDVVFLTFEGVDCFADIWLNGRLLGSPENMLIEHRYDVTDVLAPAGGSNTLEVYLRSTVLEGRSQVPPTISLNFPQPESIRQRRAPHTYGWDIMPRLVSAGLWRDVTLEVKHAVHIEDAFWYVERIDFENGNRASVYMDYTVSLPVRFQEGRVRAEYSLSRGGKVRASGSRLVAAHSGRARLTLENADLWWPRGYGEPALYDATLRLVDTETGEELDSRTCKMGVRTVALDRTDVSTKDNPGRFVFIVNDVPIFARGSNWTPMDALHSRDPQHLEGTFKIVTDLNCNMLRCWGGNVYEDHPFYDLCDREGVLVWQDFSMGCTMYPQDAGFQKAIGEEIRSVVRKLRSHPCIALWSGNNEDDLVVTWSLKAFGLDPNRDVVSRVTIPQALFETDPTRPYLPSSPYYGPEVVARGSREEDLPENHLWGPRGYYKDSFYTGASCLFASEMGYHGMPDRASLEEMFSPENVYPWSDVKARIWKEDWPTKSVRVYREEGYTPDRNNLMINQVHQLFGDVPEDLDSFIYASQTVQAEAMKYFVERFRGYKFAPRTGLLWWNIRDGWPVISDAVVDWYGRPKQAFRFIRNVQHNVCVMLCDDEDGAGLPLVVANDTRRPCKGNVTVSDVESGKTVFKGKYRVEENGRTEIARIPVPKGQGMLLISYTGEDGTKLSNHYLYGAPPFKLDEYRRWLGKTGIYKRTGESK